ncbi:hypothetical protein SAMN04488168_11023 [Bacillus sp. 491mf]|uniref:hypothetical protein n=1 Tax=Bacillus sp. 491mf TaxID=1761755 RepID=UPI0008E2118F|nr:hypothetical protein [Bacillus sp. 491mf]SFC81951.1 hypothetical protein SAMN04488168_11023 [Bacillus sp. 491mf]
MQEELRGSASGNQPTLHKGCGCKGSNTVNGSRPPLKAKVTSMNPSSEIKGQSIEVKVNPIREEQSIPQEIEKESNPLLKENDQVLNNETGILNKMISWLKRFIR